MSHRDDINVLSESVIGAAMEVHSALGPGLLESSYHVCLSRELELREVPHRVQVPLELAYKGISVQESYRIDILVAGTLVCELKSVEALTGIHQAQLLTYLKHGGYPIGLLINFNTPSLRQGIKRMVNRLDER